MINATCTQTAQSLADEHYNDPYCCRVINIRTCRQARRKPLRAKGKLEQHMRYLTTGLQRYHANHAASLSAYNGDHGPGNCNGVDEWLPASQLEGPRLEILGA